MSKALSPAVVAALREFASSQQGAFPGAIGRSGTVLVRAGLARRLGLRTYGGTYRNGERPDRWVEFELTPSGQRLTAATAAGGK